MFVTRAPCAPSVPSHTAARLCHDVINYGNVNGHDHLAGVLGRWVSVANVLPELSGGFGAGAIELVPVEAP